MPASLISGKGRHGEAALQGSIGKQDYQIFMEHLEVNTSKVHGQFLEPFIVMESPGVVMLEEAATNKLYLMLHAALPCMAEAVRCSLLRTGFAS